MRLVAMLALAVPPAAHAAAESATPGYSIACRVAFSEDPAMTAPLDRGVRDQIGRMFQAVLGPELRFRFLESDPAAGRNDFSLDALDAARAAQAWPGPERLLQVGIERRQNRFVVQAREWDPLFQRLGPLLEQETNQRDLVPDTVARLAIRAFSPVAAVVRARGAAVRIEFFGGERIHAHRAWLGLEGDMGLELLREEAQDVSGPDGARVQRTRYRRTFLALRGWRPDAADCELVGPDSALLRDAGASTGLRYLARPAPGSVRAVRVRAVRQETRAPQEGCEVFASNRPDAADPTNARGITDRDGMAQFEVDSRGVQFVTLQYEGLIAKAPLLPGVSPDPLVFELPTRGHRDEYVRTLRRLNQELGDQVREDNQLRQDLSAAVKANDPARLRELLAPRDETGRIRWEEADRRISEIEAAARVAGEDVAALADRVRANARSATRSLDLDQYAEWVKQLDKANAIRALTGRITERQREMDWPALVPLYEQLSAADPENAELRAKLRRLQNDLRVKNDDHEKARGFVDGEFKNISVAELPDRWGDMERAARTLLSAHDHLWLLKVRRSLVAWSRELATQVRDLADAVRAAGDDPARSEELDDRRKKLQDVHRELSQLYGEVNAYLKGLDL